MVLMKGSPPSHDEAIRCSGGPLGCGGCNGAGFGACTNERDLEKKYQSPSKMGEIHDVFDEEAFNQILVKLSFDS